VSVLEYVRVARGFVVETGGHERIDTDPSRPLSLYVIQSGQANPGTRRGGLEKDELPKYEKNLAEEHGQYEGTALLMRFGTRRS